MCQGLQEKIPSTSGKLREATAGGIRTAGISPTFGWGFHRFGEIPGPGGEFPHTEAKG